MDPRPMGVVEPLPLVIVRTGQSPVRQGEPSTGLWRIQSGVLCATVVNAHGRERWIDLMGPGDLVGEVHGGVAPWTWRALRPSRLVATRSGADREALIERTSRMTAVAMDLAWLDVPGRIERRLLDLAERFGRPVPSGTAIPLLLRHEDLAALAGTTRESASRAVRTLTAAGRIARMGRGRYVVRVPLRGLPRR
jgi:CRP/FNR family cyclic AMP-dependent transcriptional regulator